MWPSTTNTHRRSGTFKASALEAAQMPPDSRGAVPDQGAGSWELDTMDAAISREVESSVVAVPLTRHHVIDVLRKAGLPEMADDALRELPGSCGRLDDECAEEPGDFVAGQRDLVCWCRAAGVLGGGGDGEEGGGEHGQGGPPVPGVPAADLVLIQPGQPPAGLEILLCGPAQPSDLDQGGQRDRAAAVAPVERQLPRAAAAADQQPAAAGTPRVAAGPGPLIPAGAPAAPPPPGPPPTAAGQAPPRRPCRPGPRPGGAPAGV